MITLIGTIAAMFAVEMWLSRPDVGAIVWNLFVPQRAMVTDPGMLFIAVGILGATVMPHNLYLHSSIVQSRKYLRNAGGKREAISWRILIRRWR